MPRIAVTSVALPPTSALTAASAPAPDHVDAYQVALPDHAPHTAAEVAGLLLAQGPAWVRYLLRLRDWLVRPFQLTTFPPEAAQPAVGAPLVPGGRLGLFRVFSVAPREVILGLDDRHLDFRVSVLLPEAGPGRVAVVATIVWFKNRLGRLYFGLIRPFHHLIVPALLRYALRPAPPHLAPTR